MFQLIKKFIAPDAVDGAKIKLLNNQSIRVLDASDSEVEVLKVDGSDVLVLNAPEIDMSANVVKNIGEARVDEVKIGADLLSIVEGSVGESPALSLGAVEMLSSAEPSSADSLTNKAYVDGKIATLSGGAGAFSQYSYVIQSGDVSNGYVDLDDKVVHNSLVAVMARQMLAKGADFTLSDVGAITRLTFAGDIAAAGAMAAEAGDILYVTYRLA